MGQVGTVSDSEGYGGEEVMRERESLQLRRVGRTDRTDRTGEEPQPPVRHICRTRRYTG
jgi:hypothetical protein